MLTASVMRMETTAPATGSAPRHWALTSISRPGYFGWVCRVSRIQMCRGLCWRSDEAKALYLIDVVNPWTPSLRIYSSFAQKEKQKEKQKKKAKRTEYITLWIYRSEQLQQFEDQMEKLGIWCGSGHAWCKWTLRAVRGWYIHICIVQYNNTWAPIFQGFIFWLFSRGPALAVGSDDRWFWEGGKAAAWLGILGDLKCEVNACYTVARIGYMMEEGSPSKAFEIFFGEWSTVSLD